MQADSSLVNQVIPNQNYFAGRNGVQPQWVICHGTAGGSSAQGIANYFASTQNTNNPVSSHYVIGTDGDIIECCPESGGAWANGILTPGHDPWWSLDINPNNQTISIEHVKSSTDDSNALTSAQQSASFRLIADICHRNAIPARQADGNGGVTGHFSVDPVNRSHCPGTYPWDALWSFLQQGAGVPSGWNDDGTNLTAPNGFIVTLGFRHYVLTHPWVCENVPLENAYGASPAILHRPDLGGGTRQCFRDGLLWWTGAQGVVCEPFLGLELDAAYKALALAVKV